jgi:hypothetical protein
MWQEDFLDLLCDFSSWVLRWGCGFLHWRGVSRKASCQSFFIRDIRGFTNP